jgi:hypothetical protein
MALIGDNISLENQFGGSFHCRGQALATIDIDQTERHARERMLSE